VRTVLLTGASGVVGRAIAAELVGMRVIGLVHADDDLPGWDQVLRSDLALPRLGLDETTWRRLVDEVDVVVHSGALTQWGQPYGRYAAINVEGTRRVAELAIAADAPVHFVGTCFVHAIERGGLDRLAADNVVSPYIRSKLAAERVLEESGVRHSVFRPTNLVGDSRTGASLRPQILQAMSDWICRGKAPYLPMHPGNRVDVVPLDVLAIAIARAVERDDLGRRYWVTAGHGAMEGATAIDVLVEHVAAQGRTIARPPIVDPRGPMPVPLAEVSALSRTFVKVLIDVSEVTHECGGVLPSSLAELHDRLGVPVASDVDAFRKSLEYWAGQRGQPHATAEEAR
jgi:thioester reductase-like protein